MKLVWNRSPILGTVTKNPGRIVTLGKVQILGNNPDKSKLHS